MPAGLRLRAARSDEAELLLGLQKAAAVAAFAHIFPPEKYPFPDDAVLERWQTALADSEVEVVVAELDRCAVGLAAVRPEWLDGLYVTPDAWGTGVGARLHDHAVMRVRERGCTRCHLWVLEDNGRARRFYEHRGWQLNGKTRIVPFPPEPVDVGYTLEL